MFMDDSMITPTFHETRRKFYNKWLYKITLESVNLYVFRVYSFKRLCYHIKYKTVTIHPEIANLVNLLSAVPNTSWAKRLENLSTIHIYTNSKDLVMQIQSQLPNRVVKMYEPDPRYLSNLNTNNTILVKKLPHRRYKHKVFIRLLDDSLETKTSIMNWIFSKNPHIKCTKNTKRWFLTANWDFGARSILVEDEQHIMLLKLYHPDLVCKIYNFVETQSITSDCASKKV